jgi:hypothetical protein
MAYVTGVVTEEEKKQLEEAGWDVELAETYGLVGTGEKHLMEPPPAGRVAIVIFVDCAVGELIGLSEEYFGVHGEHRVKLADYMKPSDTSGEGQGK